MALSQKQLEALSTLTGPAALDGSMSFDDVLAAVLHFCPNGHVPRIFIDRMGHTFGPQVVIGIADVARLLLAQGEHIEALRDEVAEWRSGGRVSGGAAYMRGMREDERQAVIDNMGPGFAPGSPSGWRTGRESFSHLIDPTTRAARCAGYMYRGDSVAIDCEPTCPGCLNWRSQFGGEDDLAIPPESLDGRTRPVDPTERDPVEVATFGVGSISPEAEAMRRGEVL